MTVSSGNGQPYNYSYNYNYGQTLYTPPPPVIYTPPPIAYQPPPPPPTVPVPVRSFGLPQAQTGYTPPQPTTYRGSQAKDQSAAYAPMTFRGLSPSATLGTDPYYAPSMTSGHQGNEGGHQTDFNFNPLDPQEKVGRLRQDGDQVVIRTVFEGKAEVGPGIPYVAEVKGGVKAQYGGELRISQVGDGDNAQFVVDVEKQTLVALVGDVGAIKQKVGLEIGVQPQDSVEMTFATREDAVRATRIVQRVVAADALSDSASIGVPTSTSPGSGSNPAGNPLNTDGAPGYWASEVTDVSAEEQQFLSENITAYETTIGIRGRVKGELATPFPGVGAQLESRLDGRQQLTRRVELPTDTEAGRASYSISLDGRVSVKEKAQIGILTVQNRLEMATDRTTLTAHYEIPAGTDVSTSPVTDRPLPEANLLINENFVPDGFTIERQIEWRDDTFLTLSRGASNRATFTFDVNNVDQLPTAFGHVVSGDPAAAAQTADVTARAELVSIERDGFDTQEGLKHDTQVIGGVEGTLITTIGVDRIIGTRAIEFDSNAAATIKPTDQPEFALPEQVTNDGKTLVVEPENGLVLRDGADGKRIDVFQNGTFLRQTGAPVTDANGVQWIPVTGTDVLDTEVSGFVHSDFVRQHSSARGAMDLQGRVDPTLDLNRFTKVTVQEGENLFELADRHGVEFEDLVTENQIHLIDPSLVFAGDTVYIPNTGQGPELVRAPVLADDKKSIDSESFVTESEGVITIDGSGSIPGVAEHAYLSEKLSPGVAAEQGSSSGTDSSSLGQVSDVDSPVVPYRLGNPQAPAVVDQSGDGAIAARTDLGEIQRDYQVGDSDTLDWEPHVFGVEVPDFIAGDRLQVRVTEVEAGVLNELGPIDQVKWARITQDTLERDDALVRAEHPDLARGTAAAANDGHVDAVRHTLWNARLTSEFGEEWTTRYTSAHEMVPGNYEAREAMDLYNNEVGRQIAIDNPDATTAQLEGYVMQALNNGELLVINSGGQLAWSDQVAVGDHGFLGN